MARISKQETYATESHIEKLAQAKLSAKEETSTAQEASEIQGIAVNNNDAKAAIDFANAKKSDVQLQATLLKGKLQDTASRLDNFREGDLKGLQKDAKKFAIEDLGVIKDNLGKDIVRHEGPGINDMYNKSKKYEMLDRDPLKGLPKTEKQEKDAKKAPDMPFKDDPSLVSADNDAAKRTHDGLQGLIGIGGGKGNPKEMSQGEKMEKVWGVLKDSGVLKAGEDAINKAKDGGTKYSDPDQVDASKVEKPKDPPPNSKDLLGHKVNPLNNDPIIDTENIDIKKVVAEHKGLNKTLIYTDPDQSQQKVKFDSANPPRIEENELKNTGNPNDFNGTQFELPKGGGDKPHTDGEGGDNQPQNFKAAGTTSGNNKVKVSLPFGNSGTTPTDDDEEDVGPNVPH